MKLENYYAKQISNLFASYAKSRSIGHAIEIETILKLATFQNSLEAVKNKVSEEQNDYTDLVDIIEMLPVKDRIYKFFMQTTIPSSILPLYGTKVISDIDNTAFESRISNVKFVDGKIVPGFKPMVKFFTRNFKTTPTFISARPKLIENATIKQKREKLKASGFDAFSVMSGNAGTVGKYILSHISKIASSEAIALSKMAQEKFENYLKLKRCYPHCRFIFFGDDTQADEVVARMIVANNPNNFAYIRRVKNSSGASIIENRVLHHSSYFDAVAASPEGLIPTRSKMQLLTEMAAEFSLFEHAHIGRLNYTSYVLGEKLKLSRYQ